MDRRMLLQLNNHQNVTYKEIYVDEYINVSISTFFGTTLPTLDDDFPQGDEHWLCYVFFENNGTEFLDGIEAWAVNSPVRNHRVQQICRINQSGGIEWQTDNYQVHIQVGTTIKVYYYKIDR